MNTLNPAEQYIIEQKGTERAFSGKYFAKKIDGIYRCKKCNAELFQSDAKFDSRSGWPSFDDAIAGAVEERADTDGRRVEIVCASCGGHLGHVFRGEGFSPKQTRHCVNSASIQLAPQNTAFKKAYFAAGCFWGVEYYFELHSAVLEAKSGYMGGERQNPTYEQVCSGATGHLEAVEVLYDESIVGYEELVRYFFEIHDFSQADGQGNDIGPQYLSAIFYQDDQERHLAQKTIDTLRKTHEVATKLLPFAPFYEAEAYHQDYYFKNLKQPYCHFYRPLEWR